MMDNESIKENIFRRRNEKGISQGEMAKRIGVVRNTYRSIEKGSLPLISGHLEEIAKALDTTKEELVLGYSPLNGSGQLREMKMDFDRKQEEIREHYEKIISGLREKLTSQEKEIRDLREIIESKNEIISLIKRK
jgi:transcriptional regulator with XRE-family HTH domain